MKNTPRTLYRHLTLYFKFYIEYNSQAYKHLKIATATSSFISCCLATHHGLHQLPSTNFQIFNMYLKKDFCHKFLFLTDSSKPHGPRYWKNLFILESLNSLTTMTFSTFYNLVLDKTIHQTCFNQSPRNHQEIFR